MRAIPRELLLPLLTGLFSLSLTLGLWRHEVQVENSALQARFNASLRQTASRVEQRVGAYVQMLHGTRGLFDASPSVSRQAYALYTDALMKGADFAGLQAMLYTPLLSGNQLAAHVAAQRAQGADDYAVRPPGLRSLHAPITYVAPPVAQNLNVLGLDQYADPVRREAMEQARDSGAVAITHRLRLVMDPRNGPETAFIMFMPVYAKGQAVDTLTGRRAHLTGWVQAAFRMTDLIASLYGEYTPGVDLSIHDGVVATPETLMYDSSPRQADQPPPRFEAREYISFAGHDWSLVVRSRPDFEAQFGTGVAAIILVAGSSLSALLALLVWQLVTGSARAHAKAQAMTRELRESEETMRHMAQHDPLTRLPNRALFSDLLQSALARARRDNTRAALMFVDLDRFKPVNDVYGHAVGDTLLRDASERMRECLRESDTLARIGGDEFVVLLPRIDTQEDAEIVAERIRVSLNHPFLIGSYTLGISASIGIGIFPEHGADDVTLMKTADDAMYRAKDAGRDRLVFAL